MSNADKGLMALAIFCTLFVLALTFGCAGSAQSTKPIAEVKEACPDPWVLCLDEAQADALNRTLAAAGVAMRKCADKPEVKP